MVLLWLILGAASTAGPPVTEVSPTRCCARLHLLATLAAHCWVLLTVALR